MALRVLLADESSTIKKVIQLSLHDFGVEIKSVGNGLDALSLVESYRPDLIFVDVLLSKKSGYEVIREIKTHPDLGQIPVVLMWSGFMQLDETKAKASQADARLEKPFDSEQLREIAQRLVPKTKTNPVSQFLVFPQMPEFQENQRSPMSESPGSSETSKTSSHGHKQPEASFSAEAEGGWSQQSLAKKTSPGTNSATHEEFEEFSFDDLSLPQLPPEKREVEQKHSITRDLHEKTSTSMAQRPPQPEATQPPSMRTLSQEIPNTAPGRPSNMNESIVIKPPPASREFNQPTPNQNTNSSQAPSELARATAPAVSEARVEEIIREEVRMILQRLCTKLVPEIAERAVKEEIQKILSSPPPGV